MTDYFPNISRKNPILKPIKMWKTRPSEFKVYFSVETNVFRNKSKSYIVFLNILRKMDFKVIKFNKRKEYKAFSEWKVMMGNSA